MLLKSSFTGSILTFPTQDGWNYTGKKTFFTWDLLTCQTRKSTGVNNNTDEGSIQFNIGMSVTACQ